MLERFSNLSKKLFLHLRAKRDSIKAARRRRRAMARIRAFRIKLPPDWKFDRAEANSR